MELLRDILKGMVIGVANIIPGVSGGTMLLVMGIYGRVISSIESISMGTIKATIGVMLFKKKSLEAFTVEMREIDAPFLIKIGVGAIVSILILAKLMTLFLTHYHDPTYGFFFGLVLISAVAPFKLIRNKNLSCLFVGIVAVGLVIGVTGSISGDDLIEKARIKTELRQRSLPESNKESTNPPVSSITSIKRVSWIFLMGGIAISAMILPGVSGSFLLLLLGGYFEILNAINNRDILTVSIFATGCLVGILLFSHLLNYLLKRWHDATMAFLLGLVIGSLWAIWPFKNTAIVGDETIYLTNTLPVSMGSNEIYTLVATLAGMMIVIIFLWIEKKRETNQPESKSHIESEK